MLRVLSPRFQLTLLLVAAGGAAVGIDLAPRNAVSASATTQEGPDIRLVYLCADPASRCSVPETLGRSLSNRLPIEASDMLELNGRTPIQLSGFPAILVMSGGRPVGAIVGSRSEFTLSEELDILAATADPLPMRRTFLRSQLAATPHEHGALLLKLHYRDGRFVVDSLSQIAGQAPSRERDSLESYIVQIRDAQGRVLESRPWRLNRFVSPPPPLSGEEPGHIVERTEFQTAIVLPLYAEATSIRILQPYGVDGLSIDIDTPELRAVRIADPTSGATPLHITGPNSMRLTILFLGDRYGGKTATFASDVDIHTAKFLSTRPIKRKKNRNKINIYRVDLGQGLKCQYGCAGIDRLICCNDAKVSALAATSGVPYDEIVVLVDKAKYGGSGGSYAVAYNRSGPGRWGPEVTVHESGHSMFGLMDEYEYGSTGSAWGPNCAAAPCPWKGVGLGCWEGCSYVGLSRPTQSHCLMRTLTPAQGRYEFCKVGRRRINRVIKGR